MGLNTTSGLAPTIPESVYMFLPDDLLPSSRRRSLPARFADRMKFSAFMWFMSLWLLFRLLPDPRIGSGGGGWLGGDGALSIYGGAARWSI